MKFLQTILLLLLLPIASWAQQPWDEYIEQYNSATSGQERLTALDSVLSKSFRNNNDIFFEYSFKFIELAKQLQDYKGAAKKAMNLSYPLNSANRPEESIAVITDVLQFQEKIQDSFLVGGLYLKRGGGYFRTDLKKAVADYTTAIANFGAGDSLYVADAYLFRGQANVSLGDFIAASKDYNYASLYFEQLKDYQYMLHANQGNIMMFSMNGFYDLALEKRTQLLSKLKELGLYEFLSTTYYNQAVDDRKVGANQQAFNALLEAEKYLDSSMGKSNLYFAVNGLLSTHYMETGDAKKSLDYLNLLEARYKTDNADLLMDSHYNSAKSFYLMHVGKLDEALVYATKKLENARAMSHEEEIVYALESLSMLYERMGDLATSYDYYKAYNVKKDSLYNRNKTNSLLYYQTLYESEKDKREITTQNASIALLEQDNSYFKKGIVLIAILSVLLLGLFYLVREKRDLKRSQVMQQKYSQDLLIQQETERKRIAKELHDGLGQNLLLIKNSVYNNGDSKSSKMIAGAIDEVRTISRALHPFQLQDLGLTKAIKTMLLSIDENTTLFITSDLDNIDGLFSKEEEVNIYRIIQESYSNIIKHANAEASKIKVKKTENNLAITIQDNGQGFNFMEKYKDVKSMGLKTLKERTRLLHGVMKITSEANKGTRLDFNIPRS